MECAVGVDESGKGDFFGPLVIAACYVAEEHVAELDGVRDSKTLSDSKALALAPRILRTCPSSVVAIGPAKYNELYESFRNLNRLLAWGHARAVENVLEVQPCNLVISDQFADPAGLKRALFERGRSIELRSVVRAEQNLCVAAASVLARAEFLRRLRRLGEELGTELPKGAGPQVLEAGRRLVAAKGPEVLRQYAKVHFKTASQLLAAQ